MLSAIIARELGVQPGQVEAALELMGQGNTVPFIARYRKEKTGGLDDTQLRALEERSIYLRELEDRKEAVCAAVAEQGKLTAELERRIRAAGTKARLEDLYLPFKKRRTTRADRARAAGLDPLVDELIGRPDRDPGELAEGFVAEGYPDAAAVLGGARAILTDRFATDADLVGELRDRLYTEGVLRSTAKAGAGDARFADYADFAEPVTRVPSHRILAVFRGEAEGALAVEIDGGDDAAFEGLIARRFGLDLAASSFLSKAVRFAWRTKLMISSALDVRLRLKERAEQAALGVFAANLKDVLLAAPAGHKTVLGLDPGYRNGVKCAVVDPTGKVLETTVVYPHPPAKRWGEAHATLSRMVREHGVDLVAVGNGTASRETTALARELDASVVVVSEAGASVYSASEIAAAEFPTMDVALRGAVSIARRLQDPLAELVKIDPKSIGVGQYQHDVNQRALARTLDGVVENAVNLVGVDVNSASVSLLERVSGITPGVARAIVRFRDENGAFEDRRQLLEVPRLGPKTFEQCAGFLRIPGAREPLDGSAVHPESYPVARAIARATGRTVPDLIGNRAALDALDPAGFVTEEHGLPTVRDIIIELEKPGRDPRPEFAVPEFREDVETIADLKPGMVLSGTVTNVTAFGAFVDVGVHQDGLVHVSAMARRFVADPHEVVRSGQVVRVKVLDVDTQRRRISFSLRLDDEPATGGREGRSGSSGKKSRAGAKKTAPAREPRGGAMAEALRRAGLGGSRRP